MYKLIDELNKINRILKNNQILKNVTPLTSTIIANQKDKKISVSSNVFSYLQTIEFPGTNKIENFKPNKKTYTPLIKVNKEQDIDETINYFIDYVLDEIIISKNPGFKQLLRLVLGETTINITEHSNYSNLFLTCQKWGDSIEISIMDDGVGFKKSLKKDNEGEALNLAVFEGVSSKITDGGRGWGLQHLKASVLNEEINGEFCAISNKNYIYFGEDKIRRGELDFSSNGVLICLRFNNLDSANFEKAYFTALDPYKFLIQKKYLSQH